MSKKEREAEEDTWKKQVEEETGRGRKCEGYFEKGRCTLPIKVDCRRK